MIQALVKQDLLSDSDKELIKNILNYIEITEYQIVNLKFNRPDNNLFTISFGNFESKILKEKLIILPEIKYLYDKPLNQKYRLEASEKLLEFKEWINYSSKQEYKLETKNLPEIPIQSLLNLRNELIKENKTNIITLDKNGKKINITLEKDLKDKTSIMFSELIALQIAKNVFGLDVNKKD